MNYFTPALYADLQAGDDAAMDAADAAWQEAERRYRLRLDAVRDSLPSDLARLLETYSLHDAEVSLLADGEAGFFVQVRPESPPRDLVLLVYRTTAEPAIDRQALPPDLCSTDIRWMADEVGPGGGPDEFSHEILLSNGWTVRLLFSDVTMFAARDVLATSGWSIAEARSA